LVSTDLEPDSALISLPFIERCDAKYTLHATGSSAVMSALTAERMSSHRRPFWRHVRRGDQNSQTGAMIAPRGDQAGPVVSFERRVWLQPAAATVSTSMSVPWS